MNESTATPVTSHAATNSAPARGSRRARHPSATANHPTTSAGNNSTPSSPRRSARVETSRPGPAAAGVAAP